MPSRSLFVGGIHCTLSSPAVFSPLPAASHSLFHQARPNQYCQLSCLSRQRGRFVFVTRRLLVSATRPDAPDCHILLHLHHSLRQLLLLLPHWAPCEVRRGLARLLSWSGARPQSYWYVEKVDRGVRRSDVASQVAKWGWRSPTGLTSKYLLHTLMRKFVDYTHALYYHEITHRR
jgi:hypothetical protein